MAFCKKVSNTPTSDAQPTGRFIQCSNGHYYTEYLERCPYCGSVSSMTETFYQDELWCHPSEYIIDDKGYYYMINPDGETASFLCWSKAAWNVYHDYMRFYDWYIECTIDDAQAVKRQEEYFDTVRIKHQSEMFKIPREIVWNDRTYPVVRIRSGAFAFSEINSIVIPDTIIHIEENTFLKCDKLKELIIPDSVKVLSSRAISGCKNLIEITWKGITYANDICEPFVFPDYKDKYAIKLNNVNIANQSAIEYTPEHISQLASNEIFVFGSNIAGIHGGGAARYAYEHFGAEWGNGIGLAGQSYAIPTMHGGVREIKPYVDKFIEFAEAHPQYRFLVTPIGCGIAGFTSCQIAPLFFRAIHIPNIILPKDFYDVLLPLEENVINQIIH